MINRIQASCSHLHGDNFRAEVFCSNATVHIYLLDNLEQKSSCTAEGSEQAFIVIRNMLRDLKLLFSPNLDDGIQTVQSAHGLISIFCCGTLHQEDALLGIFEQEFGLVLNPRDKTWKIASTKVNLKKCLQASKPSLPPSQKFAIQL